MLYSMRQSLAAHSEKYLPSEVIPAGADHLTVALPVRNLEMRARRPLDEVENLSDSAGKQELDALN